MTAPTLPGLEPVPASAAAPRPGSRAARMALPRSVDVLKEIAAEYGVCVRPLAMRRTDLDTGLTEVIDLPCGAPAAQSMIFSKNPRPQADLRPSRVAAVRVILRVADVVLRASFKGTYQCRGGRRVGCEIRCPVVGAQW